MRIRKARPTDLIICANLKRSSDSTKIKYSKKDEMLTRKYLKRYFDDEYSTLLIAEDGDDIIGYIVFSYDEWNNSAHIDQIFVRPDKQNQGVGSKLIDDVVNRAKKQGIRIVFLETGTKENNAIRFYKKNGFSVSGHINGLYRKVPGDALILSRKLR
jgi:ribosomal-protein-alanine N-acetyltransferase